MPERQVTIEKIMYCGYCQEYGKCVEIVDINKDMNLKRTLYVCYSCLDKINKGDGIIELTKGGI